MSPKRYRSVHATDMLQEQIDQMENIPSLAILSGNGPCKAVMRTLEELRRKFREARCFAEAAVVMRGAVALQKDISAQDLSESETELVMLMYSLSYDLHQSQYFADSCAVDEEVALMLRRLYDNDPDRHRLVLAVFLNSFGCISTR
jgi:hypothetical protein